MRATRDRVISARYYDFKRNSREVCCRETWKDYIEIILLPAERDLLVE